MLSTEGSGPVSEKVSAETRKTRTKTKKSPRGIPIGIAVAVGAWRQVGGPLEKLLRVPDAVLELFSEGAIETSANEAVVST